MSAVEQELRGIVGEYVKDKSVVLAADTSFTDIGLDSLDMLMVVDAIETQFGVKFGDEDFAELDTLGDAYRIVESRVGAA